MEIKMDYICLMCEHRVNAESKSIHVCPICGSDDIGYIPRDKQLIRI